MPVNIFKREYLDFVERLPSDIVDHMVSNPVIAHIHHPLRNRCKQHNHYYFLNNRKHRVKIHQTLINNIVNRIAG